MGWFFGSGFSFRDSGSAGRLRRSGFCRSCYGPGEVLIVADQVAVENGLLDGLEPSSAAFDAEVLVEQGAVEALDDAVGLRPRPLHTGDKAASRPA